MEFTHTFTVSDEQVEELKLLQKAMQNYSIENGDTEEEAKEDAEMEIESRIEDWEIDGCEYERELFEVIIEEV